MNIYYARINPRVKFVYICPLTHLFCYKCVVRLNMHPNIQTHMEYTWNIYEYSILKSIHSSRAFSIHKHHSHRCLQPPHFLCQQPRAFHLIHEPSFLMSATSRAHPACPSH